MQPRTQNTRRLRFRFVSLIFVVAAALGAMVVVVVIVVLMPNLPLRVRTCELSDDRHKTVEMCSLRSGNCKERTTDVSFFARTLSHCSPTRSLFKLADTKDRRCGLSGKAQPTTICSAALGHSFISAANLPSEFAKNKNTHREAQ